MQTDTVAATRLMVDFAAQNACALVNALDLCRETVAMRWRDLAVDLVDQVHAVPGPHRSDDPRTGWLSGLPKNEGARPPTGGGLRIGTPLPAGGPAEPHDERLEREREGQYCQDLTRRMGALSRAAILLDAPRDQACAEAPSGAAFVFFLQTHLVGRPTGLVWKRNVDLSRSLVAGIRPHDALDGYVTVRWLSCADVESGLADDAAVLRPLAENRDCGTADPLGLGELLLDAIRLAPLADRHEENERPIAAVPSGVDAGLSRFPRLDVLELPPDRRPGFREFGLAIGFKSLPTMAGAGEVSPDLARSIARRLDRLCARAGTGQRIVVFWSEPKNRQARRWQDHRDLNEVMLAAALLNVRVGTMNLAPVSETSPAGEGPTQP